MASASPMPNRFGLPPPKFSGKACDWDSFERKFRAYMCVANSEYNKVFARIATATEEIDDNKFIRDDGTPNEDMLKLSYQLKWVLENVCDGSSEAVVSSSASDHGFEI